MGDYKEDFIFSFEAFQNDINKNAKEKGFWDDDGPSKDGEKIALMHSELSEALEAIRNGNPQSDKIPQVSNLEEELADTVIRIMDFAHQRGLQLPFAIYLKHHFNTSRPFKHGKKF